MRSIFLLLTACSVLAAEQLKPQLTYNDEDLRLLKGLKTEQKPTPDQLVKWDGVLEKLIVEKPLEDGDASRLTTYLYVAQNDFAALSQKQSGEILGSFGPVSEGVIRLFYPRYQPTENAQDDQYTMALSMIVMEKMRDRFIQDQSGLRRSRIIRGPVYWQGDYPYYGLKMASYKPWKLKACNEYRCEKLSVVDDAFWNEQLTQMKEAMKDLTPEQKKAISYWVTGDWINISNDYMQQQNIPLEKRLAARAAVAIAVQDALIGAFDSKYAYSIRRPSMIEENLETVIPAPNHPSYPSGHSTVGKAAEGVLTHFFPENKEQWARQSEEAGLSRIWAGIHFPVDHSAGQKLGKQVAESTLSR